MFSGRRSKGYTANSHIIIKAKLVFDSPLDICPVCSEWVLMDQTQKECAREHHCAVARCPLERFFTGFDFSRPDNEEPGCVLGKGARRR